MTNAKREVGLKYYADVNPLTKEFKDLPDGEEVAFLPLENIWSGGAADYSRTRSWKKSDTSYTQFRRGDVLVPKVTPTVFHGRTMVAETETEVGLATSEVHVLRPKDGVDRRWIAYSMLSSQFLDRARGAVYGVGGLQRISAGYLGGYRVPETDTVTQQRIADYLDRETAEIDAAVADLDRYVKLLEKRRLETITRAVEGSSGPGKDKLGSEEFFKPKLGYVVIDLRTGLNPRKNFELDTPGAENWYVTVRELDGTSIKTSEATSKISDQALEVIQKRARIRVGDVLFSGTGTIGNTALVSSPPSNWGVKEGIYILTPDAKRMRSDFLLWILRSRKILSLADEMSDGSTIKSIPIEKLKRVPIPLPNLSLQKLIVDYLDRESTEIDALITESKKLRNLLLKRRSVLITEVVTGRKQV